MGGSRHGIKVLFTSSGKWRACFWKAGLAGTEACGNGGAACSLPSSHNLSWASGRAPRTSRWPRDCPQQADLLSKPGQRWPPSGASSAPQPRVLQGWAACDFTACAVCHPSSSMLTSLSPPALRAERWATLLSYSPRKAAGQGPYPWECGMAKAV